MRYLLTSAYRKLRRDHSGATMIEMAFVLPIFIFMTFAIFELALIFFYSFILESAMYDVTRFAKIQLDPQAVVQEVRERIQEKSLGLLDGDKVIITTELDVDFQSDYSNREAEKCAAPNLGETCATLPNCNGEGWIDEGSPQSCDIGPPELALGQPGDIISYVAFYKKPLFTPMLGYFVSNEGFANSSGNLNNQWHLISSATVTRNEPAAPGTP